MLDLIPTRKLSRGHLKRFTFLLKDKYAVNGYIMCTYLAKDHRDAVLKMENERDHEFSTKRGDKLVES